MRYMLSALVAVTAAGAAGAQVTLSTGKLEIPEYYEKLNSIVNSQIVGYRTVVEYRLWEPLRPDDPKPVTVGRRTAVHGRDLWVSRDAIPPPRGDGRDKYVHVLSPDAFYILSHNRSAGKYEVRAHGTEWGDPPSYANAVGLFSACVQLLQPASGTKMLETSDGEYEGRPSKRITLRTSYGATLTAHVDRATYQHLYSEVDRIVDVKARGYGAGTRVRKTEYRSEGGRLWPTRQEEYQVTPDGKRQPWSETTFLEYAPHTPSADELDLEKQFGVKPIPHEPRPESARPGPPPPVAGGRAWQYAAAGLATAAAVLIMVLLRRSVRALKTNAKS
jgi:hypothetical protein